MATLRLYLEEVSSLPGICMKCGEPATHTRPKRFSWGPGWVMLLLGLGALLSGPLFLVGLICIPIFLRKMVVQTPLCDQHRHPWRALRIVTYGGLSVFAIAVTVLVALGLSIPHNGHPWESYLIGGVLATVVGGFLFLIVAALLQLSTIRPEEITNDSIRLTNVHKSFVLAAEKAFAAPPRRKDAGAAWAQEPDYGRER